MDIIRYYLLPNFTALKVCHQRYEEVAVQEIVEMYLNGKQNNYNYPRQNLKTAYS